MIKRKKKKEGERKKLLQCNSDHLKKQNQVQFCLQMVYIKRFFYFRCTLERNISLTLLTSAIVTDPIAGNVVHTPELVTTVFVSLQGSIES